MRNFVSKGDALDLVAPSGGVVAGVGLFIGALFVVPASDADEGATFAGYRTGIFDLDAEDGDGGGSVGDPIFFDASGKVATMDDSGNKPIGVLVADKGDTDTTARVVLVPRLTEAGAVALLTGTLTGTVNGAMVDVAAAAGACAGGSSPSATNVDAAIATAVAPIVSGVNEQLKELFTKVNAIIAA